MTTNETQIIGTGGIVAFWTIRQTDLPKLRDLWPELLKDYLPERRTPVAALKAALDRGLGERRTLVRPLEDEGHYAVVEELVRGDKLGYETYFACKATPFGFEALPGFEDKDHAHREVAEALETTRNELPPVAVTKALTAVVEKLQGVALRPQGGVYYLPPQSLELWAQVARAIEGSGTGEKEASAVYQLSTELDANAVRALKDALATEVSSEVERLQAGLELTGDDALGVRGLNHRLRELKRLSEKVGGYEKTLAESLSELTNVIATAEAATAAAKATLEAEQDAQEAA